MTQVIALIMALTILSGCGKQADSGSATLAPAPAVPSASPAPAPHNFQLVMWTGSLSMVFDYAFTGSGGAISGSPNVPPSTSVEYDFTSYTLVNNTVKCANGGDCNYILYEDGQNIAGGGSSGGNVTFHITDITF